MAAAGDIAFSRFLFLIDECVRSGVTDACITPGLRSTPLVLALERHPGIRTHIHLDERSAAFYALGMARMLEKPVIVAATSGTAIAHWYPAVIEASLSGIPLLLLSADRPPELRDTGENQAIDQTRMFGPYVRWFVDPGVPDESEMSVTFWRSLGCRAVAAAIASPMGPVHINLPCRKPLVPSNENFDVNTGGRPNGQPWERLSQPRLLASAHDVKDLADIINDTERGLILATTLPHNTHAVANLAERARWPLIAEPMSGLRTGRSALSAGEQLLSCESFRKEHVPDVIVHFGTPPTNWGMLAAVAGAPRVIVVDHLGKHPDPTRHAEWTLHCDPAALAAELSATVAPRSETECSRAWSAANDAVQTITDTYLDTQDELFEGRVARDVAEAMPDNSTLFVGSSMPVRDLDSFMRPRTGIRVVANRGVSGIDGAISTALGTAAATAAPVCALIGDLTFLHDIGPLFWNRTTNLSVTFVVVNNDGGGIFNLLPQASLPEYEKLFGTPHGISCEGIAKSLGVDYRLVAAAGDLSTIVSETVEVQGIHIVEVKTNRTRNAEQHHELQAAIDDALRELVVHR